ncbi:MAG: helix-turn-helix transcriptional regulator [Clostridia bacterium]|nr:helix-turn-helix transcriptional regulator [Clostridia bacterium]
MKLKEYRQKLKISQTALANKIGIPQTTYSHYEVGTNEPDITTLIKLADFYKVPIDALVERKFNNIDFSKFTDVHFELLEKISGLNETQCEKLIGYIDGASNK